MIASNLYYCILINYLLLYIAGYEPSGAQSSTEQFLRYDIIFLRVGVSSISRDHFRTFFFQWQNNCFGGRHVTLVGDVIRLTKFGIMAR